MSKRYNKVNVNGLLREITLLRSEALKKDVVMVYDDLGVYFDSFITLDNEQRTHSAQMAKDLAINLCDGLRAYINIFAKDKGLNLDSVLKEIQKYRDSWIDVETYATLNKLCATV